MIFEVGAARITRIEETYGPTYPLRRIFPECTDDLLALHREALVPHHLDAASGAIMLSVHSWLLEVGGRKVLIDGCCGNHKVKPDRPFWHMLDVPWLDRLAAAGARPEDIDVVMCTHLHHDHVGWNTRQRDGRWVPTFPNARYVFSRKDVDYFAGLDADPATAPAELGTFRECVMPILDAERATLVDGPARLDEFIEIEAAPGHSPGHVYFKLESAGQRGVFAGDVLHHLLQVYYPDWNFPKNSDAEQARASRRKLLDYCVSSESLMFPGHVGFPFVMGIDRIHTGYRPDFRGRR